MTALFPELREQLHDVAVALEQQAEQPSTSPRWRRLPFAAAITLLLLGTGGVATATGLKFWAPDPGVTETGIKRQAVADPPPWESAGQFEIFRRAQAAQDQSPQAAAAVRQAGGPIYSRTASVRRLSTPDGFEAFVIPAGQTRKASPSDSVCLWVRRTTSDSSGILCTSWAEATAGKLHLSLGPQLDEDAERARGRERKRLLAEMRARGDASPPVGKARYLPSETGFTVVGLVPDAAGAMTVNGHPAVVAGNTFTATIPEAGSIVTRIKAK